MKIECAGCGFSRRIAEHLTEKEKELKAELMRRLEKEIDAYRWFARAKPPEQIYNCYEEIAFYENLFEWLRTKIELEDDLAPGLIRWLGTQQFPLSYLDEISQRMTDGEGSEESTMEEMGKLIGRLYAYAGKPEG